MKNEKFESVMRDWTFALPFMQQALLMTALRGPDGSQKHTPAKCIIRYLRGSVLKPAEDVKLNEDNFMWFDYKLFKGSLEAFFHDTDYLPMHFLMHLVHAAEVLGYKHPDDDIRTYWLSFYKRACKGLHMTPETEVEMDNRLAF